MVMVPVSLALMVVVLLLKVATLAIVSVRCQSSVQMQLLVVRRRPLLVLVVVPPAAPATVITAMSVWVNIVCPVMAT